MPASLVNKICGGSFIELGDSLYEHMFEAFIEMDEKEKKKLNPIESFQEWVLGILPGPA